MKKALAVILALLIVGGGVFFATRQHYENKKTVEYIEKEVPVKVEVPVTVETKTEITAEIIREGLHDIGELATEEYYYTEVGTYDSTKSVPILGFSINIPLTNSHFIYSYDGIIKAGIDFTEIEVEKDEERKIITVSLPKARILSSEVDEDSFQLYDERNSSFNTYGISEVNDSNRTLKSSAEEKAVARGLLDRADANAKTLIRGFLASTYELSEYTVRVETKDG